MKFQIALLAVFSSTLAIPTVVDPEVFKTFETKDTLTVIVSFKKTNTDALYNRFDRLKTTLSTRSAKLNTFYDIFKDHADTVQQNVRNFLEQTRTRKPIQISQLWITSKLIIRGIDKETVLMLEKLEDIKYIMADRIIPLDMPSNVEIHTQPRSDEPQWGVKAIKAPEVWNTSSGENIVVGHIDTGVQKFHEALRNNCREPYHWLDPYGGTSEPSDDHGHGTHTMGTICGTTNGIGVAPGAKWMSCKGCNKDGCSYASLLTCGQFITCPTYPDGTNKDCSKAPHVVSNSWGGSGGQDFYNAVIKAWKTNGIIPVFAIGNDGQNGCKTAGSPGDHPDVIAVGSCDVYNYLSYFSSQGPTVKGNNIKPDFTAPGSSVVSASHTGDSSYATMSGTSMACPHVAGVVALMLAKTPGMGYDQVKQRIAAGAERTIPSTGKNCGGVSEYTVYPNNAVGWGLINAFNAV